MRTSTKLVYARQAYLRAKSKAENQPSASAENQLLKATENYKKVCSANWKSILRLEEIPVQLNQAFLRGYHLCEKFSSGGVPYAAFNDPSQPLYILDESAALEAFFALQSLVCGVRQANVRNT